MKSFTNRGVRAAFTALAALALPLAAPALGHAQQDALPPADELIERHLDAIGGRDAVLAANNSRSTGTFSMPAAGITGELEVVSAAPNRLATRIEIPGLGVIREGYTGEIGWAVDPNLGPRLLEGMELAALKEGARTEAAVRDPSLFTVRETVERTEMGGEPCYKVRLVWKSGRESFDCYSVETGLMIASGGSQETPMGTIETVTLLEDYREFDGLLNPTTIRQQMMGMEQVITLENVEYGVVEDDAFTPPDVIQTLIEQQQPQDQP